MTPRIRLIAGAVLYVMGLSACDKGSSSVSLAAKEQMEAKSYTMATRVTQANKIEEIARTACTEAFESQRQVPELLSMEFNSENGHWQVQLVKGGWTRAKPSSQITITNSDAIVESCIVVIDGKTEAVISMRDF